MGCQRIMSHGDCFVPLPIRREGERGSGAGARPGRARGVLGARASTGARSPPLPIASTAWPQGQPGFCSSSSHPSVPPHGAAQDHRQQP